jgi:hypothetical protein
MELMDCFNSLRPEDTVVSLSHNWSNWLEIFSSSWSVADADADVDWSGGVGVDSV